MALTETLIGFCPVCRRSSTPGVPTYLQTNTFGFGGLSEPETVGLQAISPSINTGHTFMVPHHGSSLTGASAESMQSASSAGV